MEPEHRLTLAFLEAHPLEAAKQLEFWEANEIGTVLGSFRFDQIASVLEHFQSAQAAEVLKSLPEETAIEVITALPTSAAIGVLRQLKPSLPEEFLTRLDQAIGPSLRLIVSYPDGTAASLSDPRVLTLPPDILVSEALNRVKREHRYATYYHYVVERDGKLAGLVTTKELLGADPTQLVATVMNDQLATVGAEVTEEELLQHPHWRLFHSLPVVDRNGVFLGALRYRTLRRIEEESGIKSVAGSLPQALLQLWEAYALVGLRIMTDLAQVLDARILERGREMQQKGEASDDTPPPAS